jgi:hypothetical protein
MRPFGAVGEAISSFLRINSEREEGRRSEEEEERRGRTSHGEYNFTYSG